ncbi:hypothetical protein J4481_00250 [Candidatus Pacearchaeota archaeon]|nr:hypothetical protein [Candidatus Pacearchaeota archaeon]
MKHIKIITLVLIILAGIFLTTLQINSYAINSKPESTQTITLNSQKEAFDYLPQYLAGQEIIQSLPKNTAIDLKFFDFVNGKRVWLREYSLENGKILEQKMESPEIIISLHSKYLAGLYQEDFCAVLKNANTNGDLGFETDLSTASLLWKFKSIIKYKECII